MAYAYEVSWLRGNVSGSTLALVQVKAGTAASLDISHVAITTRTSASTMEAAQLVRKSTAASVDATTAISYNTGSPAALAPASSSGCGVNSFGGGNSGTDADVVDEWGFNFLGGLAWIYIPDLKVHVVAGGIVCLALTNPPVSETITSKVSFLENR